MARIRFSLSVMLLLGSCATIPSCDLPSDCDRAGCDAIDEPAGFATIESGLAGAAASQSDVVENGCGECGLADGALYVWGSPTPIETQEDAQALVDAAGLYQYIEFHETYEREETPGDYLVCPELEEETTCAAVTVGDSEVVTVHVRYLNAPSEIIVFYPGQSEPATDRIFDVDMP